MHGAEYSCLVVYAILTHLIILLSRMDQGVEQIPADGSRTMNTPANPIIQCGSNISGDEKLVAGDEAKKQESSITDIPDTFNSSPSTESNIGKQDQQSKMRNRDEEKLEQKATDALREVRIENKEEGTNEAVQSTEIPETNSHSAPNPTNLSPCLNHISSANISEKSTPSNAQVDYNTAESITLIVSANCADSIMTGTIDSVASTIAEGLNTPALTSLPGKAIEGSPIGTDVSTPLIHARNTVGCIAEVILPSSLIDNEMPQNVSENYVDGLSNDLSTATTNKEEKLYTQITVNEQKPNDVQIQKSNESNMLMTTEMNIEDKSNSTANTIPTIDSPSKATVITHNDDTAKSPAENLTGNELISTVNAGTNGAEASSSSNMNNGSIKDVLPASDANKLCTLNGSTPKIVQPSEPPSEPNNCIGVSKSATDCTCTYVQLKVSIEDHKSDMPTLSPIALPELAEHNQTSLKCEEVVPMLGSAEGLNKVIDSSKPQSLDSTKIVAENIIKENMEAANLTPNIKKHVSHTVDKSKKPLAGKPSADDHMTKKTRTEEKGPASNKSNSNPAAKSKQQTQKSASTTVQLKKPTGQVAKTTTAATKPSEKSKSAAKAIQSPGKTAGGKTGMNVKPSGKLSKPVTKSSKPGSKLGKPALASNIDEHRTPEVIQLSNSLAPECMPSVQLMTSGDGGSIGISSGVALNCSTELCRIEKTGSADAVIATMKNENYVQLMTSGNSSSIGISSEVVVNCSAESCRTEMTGNTDAINTTMKDKDLHIADSQQHSTEQHNEKAEAEIKPPSSMPEVAEAQQGNYASSTLLLPLENVIDKTLDLSIIVDTGVEEPMKITSDRQEESVKKLQAIMETETLSTMPEETVLSTTSQENNNHSESNKCEQINSSLVMSNELLIEEHVHQNDQTQMPGTTLKNTIQTELSPTQDSSPIPAVEFGAETCNGVGSHYEVEQTTSTSSPTEMEKKLVEGHNNSPDLIQTSISATVPITSMDIKEDTSNELPSIICGTNSNEDQKPMDTVSEKHSKPTSVDADPKSKTCYIL